MVAINSIDDLKDASPGEIAKAKSGLQLKNRVLERSAAMGKKVGMTRAEYIKHVEGLVEQDCPHCRGTGRFKPLKPREIGVVHPSAAHTCVLRNYYDVTGEYPAEEQIKWELQITFAIGHAIHGLTQAALKADLGDNFEDEAKVDIGGLIRGNTDGDVWVPNVAHAILEIKTMGSEFDGLSSPKEEHLLQADGMYATGLDAPFVVFLYISKAWPYPIKEFVVEHDPKIFERWMKKKGDKIVAGLEARKPPIADAQPSECGGCPYGKVCPQRLEKKAGSFARVKRT